MELHRQNAPSFSPDKLGQAVITLCNSVLYFPEMKRYSFCFILISIHFLCSAQQDTLVHKLTGFQAHYGFIIPHSEAIENVSNSNPYGFEINLMRINTSFKSWSVFSSFWFSGIQAAYINFQNPEVLGSAFLLTGFAEPVIFNSGKFLFTLRGGAGLSYHTEIYDETENPDNKFFCTRISFPVYVAARIRYRINSKTLITLSGFYNHISNGGIKQPNYGMNFPTLALGVEHTRNPFIIRKPSGYSFVNDPAGWYYRIQIISSYKVVDETETYPEKGVLVTGLNTSAFRRLGHHYALGFGAEYVNDRALKEVIYREGSDVDNKRAALTAGQDFHFGKVVFYQHFGFYVYSPYEAEDPVYQMYGLGIRLHKRIMAGVFIKAHRHIADFMGLSLSFLPGKIE